MGDGGFGPGEEFFQAGVVEALEDQDLAAGQQGAVQGEAGVFGGGADQGDGAVLDHGEEAILLGAVEPVDLVDEKQGGLAGGAAPGGILEAFLEIGDAGEDGGELDEMQAGLLGQEAGDGGLADAWGAPEDQRGQRAALQHPGEGASGAEQVILADDLRQRARAQAVGEGARGLGQRKGKGKRHDVNLALHA